MEWIDRYVDGFVRSWRSNSSLSIGLSSSDHLSVRYIDACICEDSIKVRFSAGGFFLGLDLVGKLLQLAVWSIYKGYCHTVYMSSRSLLLALSILCSTEVKSPLRGLGKRSIYNISVKSNVLV